MENRILLTLPQAAKMMGFAEAKIRYLIAEGEIGIVNRFGGVRIGVSELHKWIETNTKSIKE